MPRKTTYAGQDLSTLGGRVELVLRELFDGDQSRMATESGVSQPQISLVVGGKRSPGPRFIDSLANIPSINGEWLRTGIGEPFAASGVGEHPTVGRSLPIASCPLPGSPQVDASLLSGACFPVAEPLYKESRYFYTVQKADPIVQAGLDVRPNDLLMFETDPAFWRLNLGVLLGKLCVLKLQTDSGTVCALAKAKRLAGRLEPSFEVLGGPYGSDAAPPDPELWLIKHFGKGSRCIEPSDQPSESSPRACPTPPSTDATEPVQSSPSESPRPSMDDVAGVCLLLIRMDLCS